jgi:hypothetical protein
VYVPRAVWAATRCLMCARRSMSVQHQISRASPTCAGPAGDSPVQSINSCLAMQHLSFHTLCASMRVNRV